MKRAVTVVALSLASMSQAEEPLDPRITPEALEVFQAAVFDDEGFQLPYRLMSPVQSDPEEKRPLLLFLHGLGERGDENQRQLIHGGSVFASPEFRDRHRAFVLAPQCPAGNKPDSEQPIAWSMRLRPTSEPVVLDVDTEPTRPMRAAKRLVESLITTLPVDEDRVYVAGLSMGGYATWELAARDPGFWAAAAPICGGGNTKWGGPLASLPLWAFHGDADGAVPVDRSREMVAAINDAGGRAIYTEYPGVGHNSWTPTLESRQVWDWMFAQRR